MRWTELGASRHEIATALGTTVDSLAVTCSREGILLNQARAPTLSLQRNLRADKWDKLQKEAGRRSIPVFQLAVNLIETIIDDDMVAAVLDDEP